MNVAAHQPVLPIAMFFHWNILYAEISDEERRELPKRSYEPALDLLSDHPRITAAIELSGATLQDLEQRHPQLIDKLKTLADRGQVELLGSTWQSPFLLDVREEHFARHVRMYLRLHTEIFGSHPEGLYTPEYCADERLPRILHEYGYTWFVAWVRHVAKHLPLRERERYVARDFIFPYAFEGDDKTRVFGLPLHGDEIDGMLNASDGTYPMEDYAEHIASFAALCADRSGIMIPGIADGEFLHEGKKRPPGSGACSRSTGIFSRSGLAVCGAFGRTTLGWRSRRPPGISRSIPRPRRWSFSPEGGSNATISSTRRRFASPCGASSASLRPRSICFRRKRAALLPRAARSEGSVAKSSGCRNRCSRLRSRICADGIQARASGRKESPKRDGRSRAAG